jgi:hypothetical protein
MRTLSPLLVLAALSAAILSAVVAGCPARECFHLTDCPSGELCDGTGTCVPDDGPPGVDAGPRDGGVVDDDGGSADGGSGDNLRVPRVEQLNATVTALLRDPADAQTALVATWSTGGGGLDEIGALDLDTHQMGATPRFDFTNITGGCDVDELYHYADQAPLQLPQGDEFWFSCANGGGALVHPTGIAFAQSYRDPQLDGMDLAAFVDSGTDTNGDARVVFAERGGTELGVVRFEDTDQELAPRLMDAVDATLTFDAIAGIFTAVEGHDQLGDVVLVFDRGVDGSLPRLVPVQRNYGQLTWHGPPLVSTSLDTITLPEGTHGALFRSDPGLAEPTTLATDSDDNDVPNLLLTLPTEGTGGRAIFLRYERENGKDLNVQGSTSGFPEVSLDGASMPTTVAAAEDELLLEEYNFGTPWFAYVLSNAAIGFSIPLPTAQNDDVTNEVRRGAFESTSDRPVAILPVSATRMLIGFSNKPEIHQVGFSAQF